MTEQFDPRSGEQKEREQKELEKMKFGMLPYLNCETLKALIEYARLEMEHTYKHTDELFSIAEIIEGIDSDMTDFFTRTENYNRIHEGEIAKDKPNFHKFLLSYFEEENRIINDANKRGLAYGIEGDSWHYSLDQHAKKTGMFPEYTHKF